MAFTQFFYSDVLDLVSSIGTVSVLVRKSASPRPQNLIWRMVGSSSWHATCLEPLNLVLGIHLKEIFLQA